MGGLEWTVIAAIVTVVIAIGGVLVRLVDRLNKAEARADGAERQAVGAAASVGNAHLAIGRMERELVEHRVIVAEKYVSKETLSALETRIVDAINNLGDRLDKLFNRHA